MTEALQQNAPAADGSAQPPGTAQRRVPLCFVVDEDSSIRHFLSLVLHGHGVDTEEFPDGNAFRRALARRKPELVFLNIPLDSKDTVESVIALGRGGFRGSVQLISNRGSAVLEHVKAVGEQHKLSMLPVLKKPFETGAIIEIVHQLKLGNPPMVAARVDLEDVLNNNWIEFWYQPKIDLRRKQLAGAESFARARHPEYGVIAPGAFLPGASDGDLIRLAEQGLIAALKAGVNFSNVGVNLRLAVNMPVEALTKLSIPDIVRSHRPQLDNWAGLIIDVTENQIVSDLNFANDMAKKLARLNIKLAIDDFGRGYTSLTRIKELPFAELKLDPAFVRDCGTDKVNAPLCKSVIDLAHNFGSSAVAIGIEKAADAMALTSMGCDLGQGFLLGQPMPEERFLSLLRQRAAARRRPPEPPPNPQTRRSA